jgi:Putative DNA-binding domain
MLDLDGLSKLEMLHAGAVPESSHLEYKASLAIQNTDKNRTEISKDISAMANADGGQIVYGMTESKDHLPTGLDGGINPKDYDGLWFEQVIQQNIQPKIEGLKILAVPKADGNHYFVVTVPRSTTVHQAKDGRYYRRRNFRNDIMADYEIREAMNRNTVPELYVTIDLVPQHSWLSYQTDGNYSDPVTLLFEIGNKSNTLALYSVVQLRLDQKLKVTSPGVFEGPLANNTYIRKFAVPQQFPIFRELPLSMNDKSFNVALPKIPHGPRASYEIIATTVTPGSSTTNRWRLVQLNDGISIERAD